MNKFCSDCHTKFLDDWEKEGKTIKPTNVTGEQDW